MTSHERFAAAMEHRAPDRVPIDFVAHPAVIERMRAFYGIDTERQLLEKLGCDFYYLSVRDISQNESCLPIWRGPTLQMTERERTCPLGIRFHRQVGRSKFAVDEAIAGPLASAESEQDILRHDWPKTEWFDFAPLLSECEAFADKVIVGGLWTGILGDCYRMRGFQNFLLDMAMRPELIQCLVRRMTEFYLQLNDRCFATLKGRMQVWFFGNDFGSQGGLIFSREMFREFFYEPYCQLIRLAHSYGLKAMCHSCGAIVPIIPDLIEAGVDILDPVQTTAAGMEPAGLKQQFGDRLVFHGGVDTQHVLPRGTVQQVHDHCTSLIKTLGASGGYIFASSNNINADTPAENVDAMYRAARQTGVQQ